MISESYALAWATMRRRRRWAWAALPVFMAGAWLMRSAPWAALPLMASSFALLAYASPGTCPHCGKRFGRMVFYHNQFTTRCLNCGIRIGDPP